MRAAISPQAIVMAHFSHAYPEGCSIYFTFAAAAESRSRAEQLYDDIWRVGLTAVVRAGGTISHHHGVGLDHAPYLVREKGNLGVGMLRSVKAEVDPKGTLNPGKLIES